MTSSIVFDTYDNERIYVAGNDTYLFRKQLNQIHGCYYNNKMKYYFFPKESKPDVEALVKKIKSGEVKPSKECVDELVVLKNEIDNKKADPNKDFVSRKEFSNLLKVVEQLKETLYHYQFNEHSSKKPYTFSNKSESTSIEKNNKISSKVIDEEEIIEIDETDDHEEKEQPKPKKKTEEPRKSFLNRG